MKSKLPNTLILDEHIEKILEAKNRLKLSVLDMTLTISDAVSQLDGEKKEIHRKIAERIGMSEGNLSKWISIGSNESLLKFREKCQKEVLGILQFILRRMKKGNIF